MYHNHRTVVDIQRKVTKGSQDKRVSRSLHAKNDKEKFANWKSELDGILRVFQVPAGDVDCRFADWTCNQHVSLFLTFVTALRTPITSYRILRALYLISIVL